MVEMQSDTQRQDQDRTRMRNVESASSKKITERRLNWYELRACDEARRRTHTEESVQRRLSMILKRIGTESRRGDGQGNMEYKDHRSV